MDPGAILVQAKRKRLEGGRSRPGSRNTRGWATSYRERRTILNWGLVASRVIGHARDYHYAESRKSGSLLMDAIYAISYDGCAESIYNAILIRGSFTRTDALSLITWPVYIEGGTSLSRCALRFGVILFFYLAVRM